jgi:NAD+ synthase
MATVYYHAELRNYAVVGTAPKNEHDLGFFVKYGAGGADICPIRHLYKSQVYQLAQALDIPRAIQERKPTTDTYSAGSTQEEFFVRVPFELLDAVWAGHESGVPVGVIAQALSLTPAQVGRIADDIVRKRQTTEYLRLPGLTADRLASK